MRSIILFLAACGLACVAQPTRADPSSGGADEAKSVFDTLFATKLKTVAGTADRADDVALAKDMLALAKTSTEQPALLALLCESAHDLAAKTADGYAAAAEAMTLLAETVEAKRPVAREKLIAVLTKQSSTGKADERDAAGEALIDLLMTMGDEKFEKKQYPEAAADFRRAMTIATQKKSESLDEAKMKLELAQSRDRTMKRLASLQEKLLKDANDADTVKEIIVIHLTELNEPEVVARYVTRLKDEKLKAVAALAVTPYESLKGNDHLQLADWYREQGTAPGASTVVKAFCLPVALKHYRAYLESVDATGLARKRVEVQVLELEKLLPPPQRVGRNAEFPVTQAAESGKEPTNQGLLVEFFTDKSMNKAVAMEVIRRPILGLSDTPVVPGGPRDSFYGRITGFLEAPEAGEYQFEFTHDDYGWVWIGGKQVARQENTGTGTFTATLVKGKNPLRIEWADANAQSSVMLKWRFGDGAMEWIPSSALTYDIKRGPKMPPMKRNAAGLKPGLAAAYHEDLSFQKPLVKRIDPNIDFVWNQSAPAPGVPDVFSANWTGYLAVPKAGEYTFSLKVDNTAKLKLGGKVVLWSDIWWNKEEKVYLSEGLHHFEFFYGEEGAFAHVQLFWTTPDGGREAIPASAFFHGQ